MRRFDRKAESRRQSGGMEEQRKTETRFSLVPGDVVRSEDSGNATASTGQKWL